MGNGLLRYLLGKHKTESALRFQPRVLSLSLLVISVAVLTPSIAQAASFALGERAVIGLFRGAGGLLGSISDDSGSTGIDTLASKITATFPSHNLTVQVFDSSQGTIFNFQEVGSAQGTAFLNQFDDVGAIGLIGYSAGGLSAIRTATNQSSNLVDLLVQIDSYDPLTGNSLEDEVLPANVQTGINYYQRRNRYNFFRSGWDPTDLGGARNVSGSQNINVEDLFRDRSITHRNIDDDTRLHDRILQDIATYVLPNLVVSATPTEIIAADAVLLSALSPPALAVSDVADTIPGSPTVSLNLAAETDSTSVPEPSLLLALWAIGGGLWWAKKQHKPESALGKKALDG